MSDEQRIVDLATPSPRCHRCKTEKPASEFYKDRSKAAGVGSACKPCAREATRENQRKNPERVVAYHRRYYKENRAKFREGQLRREYGITLADYDQMLKEQAGRCAICGVDEKLHVDHCHKTGEVRGLLCTGCNRGIGFFGDDPHRLAGAIEYLSPQYKVDLA